MLECCCWELPSCKQLFHYFMEASFATISAGHSAKSALLDSTVTPLGGPSSSGLVAFFFGLFLNCLSSACSFNNDAKVQMMQTQSLQSFSRSSCTAVLSLLIQLPITNDHQIQRFISLRPQMDSSEQKLNCSKTVQKTLLYFSGGARCLLITRQCCKMLMKMRCLLILSIIRSR